MFWNKPNLAGFIVAGLFAANFGTPANAAVYKCSDGHNRTFYQDRPCQDMASEKLPSSLSKLSGKEQEQPFFWKATGEKGVLYLLGSLHFGTQTPFLFPQSVMDAFEGSNTVVIEADLTNNDEKALAAAIKGRGRYSDNSDLEIHVKQVTWNRTVEMGKKLGVNEDALRPLKPWLAALTLQSESLKQAGYSPEWGVDQAFLKKSQGRKPVLQMENLEEQIQTLESLSDQEQEQLLIHTLQRLNRAPELYRSIVDAWKKGDAESMDLVIRQDFEAGPLGSSLFKLLYEERNQRIANKLKEMADEGKTFFVVVGAHHMGGSNGLLKLLQTMGFKLSQP